MKTIKVIAGGCGIMYTENGTTRHVLKTPKDGAFQCETAQAERLVRLGVAVYVDAVVEEKAEPGKLKGHLDAADLETWDFNEIKKLAADMGVKPEGKKKADYIAAIVAVEVEVDPDDMEDPDNELPDLSVVDPE